MLLKRFPHIMRVKKTTVVPANFVFFDTETHIEGTKDIQGEGKHVLWFGWANAYRTEQGKRTREVWHRFLTSDQFFAFIKSRCVQNKPLFVYAHNLGFDLPIVGFFEHLKKHEITIDFHTFNSPPTIFKCRWKGHTIVFVDTLNYWTTSLKKLGDSVGLPKLEMPEGKCSKKLWDTYAKRDVEIISKAVDNLCEFVIKHNCGGIGFTLASLAMNAFRATHMKHEIFIHDRLKVLKLERKAYYGGFVNCFFVGKVRAKKIFNIDINSHYPAVMLGEFPTKFIAEYDNVPVLRLKDLMRRYLVIARVLINSRDQTFPVRLKKKLCYAKGRFETCLTSPELVRALKHNCVIDVIHVAVYEKACIFDSFVRYFWKLRQEYQRGADATNTFFCKILLNSLYGKFGQNGVAWVDFSQNVLDTIRREFNFDSNNETYTNGPPELDVTGYDTWTPLGCEETLCVRNLTNNLQIKIPITEHTESFPAIAAFVTAYGREFLLRSICIAGQKNCFYCDTDSLFVNNVGLSQIKRQNLFSAKKLGMFKLEKESDLMIIHGLKDYQFGSVTKSKGIRESATKVGKNTYEQIKFEGIRSVLRRGGQAYVTIGKIRKTLKRRYDKGTVGLDGWVTPPVLPDSRFPFDKTEHE